MSWRTVFNPEWTDKQLNPQWANWIEEVPSDPYVARCRLCKKKFSLSNMGRQALTSHEEGKKHEKVINALNKSTVLSCTNSSTSHEKTDKKVSDLSTSATSSFDIKDVTTAEIIWALKLVMSHSSYNSFKDAAEIFKRMFSDSEIAKKITLSSSKMAYVIAFGLAPYFHKKLLCEISDNSFVLCIDEALNRVAQKGQMDIIIRYWPEESPEVKVRYLTSVFLGHSTALDLYESFCEGVAELNLSNILQVSLDGPSVNFKFLRFVSQELKENKGISLLNIGTCSLHVVHGAFQRGNKKSNWRLNETFSAMYRIFKDSPARRSDYFALTNNSLYPLKFCQVRWVENVDVAERAILVFPDVKKYFDSVKKDLPNNMTCSNLDEAFSDKLILAKMAFFSSIANIFQPFLKQFQSQKPMIPFLYDSLSNLLRQIMSKFLKHEIVKDCKTLTKLFEIDLTLSKNHRRISDIEIGVATRSYLSRSGASESKKNAFLTECKDFLVEMCKKILEKYSLNLSIIRSLSCLNPVLMKTNPVICETRMDILLVAMVETNHLSAVIADKAKQQFTTFVNKIETEYKEMFSSFSESDDRLDIFFSSLFKDKEEFKDLWKVIKLALLVSPGNASVESGFSINKDMIVENLNENSLIALRSVYDAVKAAGGIESVKIDSEILQYAKFSRNRYHLALDEKKKKDETAKKIINEKKRIKDQVSILFKKKAKLSNDMALQAQKIDEEIHELQKKL